MNDIGWKQRCGSSSLFSSPLQDQVSYHKSISYRLFESVVPDLQVLRFVSASLRIQSVLYSDVDASESECVFSLCVWPRPSDKEPQFPGLSESK